MLGMTFDIQGPQRTQATATKLRLARASAIMCAQRSVDNAVLTASVSSLTRASYTAQFTPWSAGDLTEIDTALNRLFRRASHNMPTFPTRLLCLPASQGGLGLPRLSTYFNLRKWSMAQRALTHDTTTERAVHRLLDRAARASGSTSTTASNGFTALFPTWGGSLGYHCCGTQPIVPQKGLYSSVFDVPIALLLDSRSQRRMLVTFQARGLTTWGDLTRHAPGRPRQWLPPDIITQLLSFPAEPPGDCPPDEHPGVHAGQFWMLRGTATERGGSSGSSLPPQLPLPPDNTTLVGNRATHLAPHPRKRSTGPTCRQANSHMWRRSRHTEPSPGHRPITGVAPSRYHTNPLYGHLSDHPHPHMRTLDGLPPPPLGPLQTLAYLRRWIMESPLALSSGRLLSYGGQP